MSEHEKIDYVEFHSYDLEATKGFFSRALGWEFQDYGPDYTAFSNAGLEGGFRRSAKHSSSDDGGALIIFYSADLEATEAKVKEAGGNVVKPTFSFPGGRRFHFTEPSGNEFAVWSDRGL